MPGAQTRELWQFNVGGKFTLLRKESKRPSEPLSEKLVAKDWQALLQPRLNIAWLAPDRVFVRVIQMPKADLAETRSMVEFQLEKLSPLPPNQIVWTYEVLPYVVQPGAGQELTPHATGELQTVLVIMAVRHHVEEYLGQLEGQGYLADRLELPLLDELRATKVKEDGAWIYANVGGAEGVCMVAWWYGGVLQNLSVVQLPVGDLRRQVLGEQLSQACWAGEVEGWLLSEPKLHLVADEATAAQWLPLFDSPETVEVAPPLPLHELAAHTARRAVGQAGAESLLPPEYASRYRQLFVDRLWMRGLGAVLMIYVAGVVIYWGLVQYASWRYDGVVEQIAANGQEYTNTVQLRERLKVLRDTLELQYAALECYKSASDNLPSEVTLNSMTFERGSKVTFFGTVPSEHRQKLNDFNARLLEHEVRGQKLFSKVNPPSSQSVLNQPTVTWNFSCDLKRTEGVE
jgi:hypothetical protein